jgi:hypothetical protein
MFALSVVQLNNRRSVLSLGPKLDRPFCIDLVQMGVQRTVRRTLNSFNHLAQRRFVPIGQVAHSGQPCPRPRGASVHSRRSK